MTVEPTGTIETSDVGDARTAERSPAPAARLYYMDAVRGLAMLLGVLFHAALAYGDQIRLLWPVGDLRVSSRVLEGFAWWSHLFRMPVFFLIAGFFAKFLIERRGIAGFLRNRGIRIALPFVIFWPTLTLATLLALSLALGYMDPLPLSMILVQEAFDATGPVAGPPTTGHLWFLYYLLYFCAIAACLARIEAGWLRRSADGFFSSTGHLVYAPLVLVPALYTTLVPVAAPDRLWPQLWSFGYYGVFFLVGWHFFRHPDYLDRVERRLLWLVVAGVVGYAAFYLRLPELPQTLDALRAMGPNPPLPSGPGHLLDATLEAYLSVYWTLIALVLGRRFLDRPSAVLRYVSDASYWIYLIHIPLLFSIQVFTSRLDVGVWAKFALSTVGTVAIALVVYDLAIRYTPIGTMLNGKKRRGEAVA